MTQAYEIEFNFHGKTHFLLDRTSGNSSKAVKEVERDFDGAKILKIRKIKGGI